MLSFVQRQSISSGLQLQPCEHEFLVELTAKFRSGVGGFASVLRCAVRSGSLLGRYRSVQTHRSFPICFSLSKSGGSQSSARDSVCVDGSPDNTVLCRLGDRASRRVTRQRGRKDRSVLPGCGAGHWASRTSTVAERPKDTSARMRNVRSNR